MLKWLMKIFKRDKKTTVADVDQFNNETVHTNAKLLAQYSSMMNE